MTEAPLSLDNFSIAISRRSLIEGSDFAAPHGSSTVIVGPTGVGKSVLLRAIAGLLPLGTFTLGGSMRLHGLPAYTRGRKSRTGTWARIMSRGLVFVPAESAMAMNPSLTLEHNRRLLAPEARGTIRA